MTTTIARSAALTRPPGRRAYEPFGACRTAWRSARREVLLSGPADTGKSRLWLEKLHFCANKYPRSRQAIVRKTRKSLTQTAMVTFEQKVLPEGALGKRPGQIHFSVSDQQYEYPNGSIIAVSGLDDPEKLKSSEWDGLYFQEATEGTLNDWEMMLRGLRNGIMPWQQLMGDCNPSYPFHWLKRRCESGATLMLEARHIDNPSVTPERLAVLQAMTGVRYLRLYKGIWCAAEGLVFPEWDPRVHIVSREQLKEWSYLYHDYSLNRQVVRHVLGGADWGFSNAGVLSVYGMDNDGRLLLLEEVYQTGHTIDWWIEQALRLKQTWNVEGWLPDPSRPDYIQQFNMAGLDCYATNNSIALGIGFLRKRLQVAPDGRPRFMIYEFANTDPDESLIEAHKPTSITNEFELYVWAEPKEHRPLKEEPVDEFNHSLDVARYVCTHLDEGTDIDALDATTREALLNFRG